MKLYLKYAIKLFVCQAIFAIFILIPSITTAATTCNGTCISSGTPTLAGCCPAPYQATCFYYNNGQEFGWCADACPASQDIIPACTGSSITYFCPDGSQLNFLLKIESRDTGQTGCSNGGPCIPSERKCICDAYSLGACGGSCKTEYQACPGGTSDCCSGLVCWNGVCSNSMTCDTTTCQNTYPGSTYFSCSGCNVGDNLSGTFGSLGCAGQLCSCCSGSSPVNYGLTVQKDGTGSGTISSSPVGIDCGADCFQSYLSGTPVTLTAVSQGGSTFTGWSGGGCSGTGNCNLVMAGNTTITATFNLSSLPTAIGYVKIKHPLGILSLRLISFSDALSFLKGIFKVARFNGDTNATADLVETTDPNASPVRVKTPYGIKAWRMQR